MGLDMYLTAERFLWSFGDNEDNDRRRAIHLQFPELGDNTDLGYGEIGFKVEGVKAEVGYWRKANQIHAWFVKNVQDGEDECRPHEVEWEKLEELRDVCKRVLADRDLAPELLPSQSGFFFGGTEYDKYYFDDLERTVKIIDLIDEQLVTEVSEDGTFRYSLWDFTYRSSW